MGHPADGRCGALTVFVPERHIVSDRLRADGAGGIVRTVFGPVGDPSPALLAAWDNLATRAAEPNTFAERWFVLPAARHLEARAELHLLEVWHGDAGEAELVALMPLARGWKYGHLRVAHVTNWDHYQSFLGTPLIAVGWEQRAWEAMLAALAGMPWARNFLHWGGLVEHGPVHRGLIAAARGRCDTVYRTERAFLHSDLSPEDYYAQTVRKKKRKEINRLSARLNEHGTITNRQLSDGEPLGPWIDAFLSLEQAGWKGERGAAMANAAGTEAFFREAVQGAHAAGKLEMLRIDCDGRPIAMLINLLAPPGSFSFKIAFDEDFARYSPGVLIQINNYAILSRQGIAWMDSCAVENHSMINTMWAQRRAIIRVTVPFGTWRSWVMFRLCRMPEQAAALIRRMMRRGRVANIDAPGQEGTGN